MKLHDAINSALINPAVTHYFVGTPGVGKTFGTKAEAEKRGFDVRVVSCQSIPDEDIAAIPQVVGDAVRMLPNQMWVPGDKPMCIILDEYAKASTTVKNSLTPLIHGFPRTFQGIQYPEDTVVIVTSNPPDFGLGDKLKPHEVNRMCVVNIDDPEFDDAYPVMLELKFDSRVIEWVRTAPQALISYSPEYKSGASSKEATHYWGWRADAPTAPFCSMRSLHLASTLVAGYNEVTPLLRELLGGVIGRPAALSLCGFLSDLGVRVPVSEIFAKPEETKVPKTLMPQRAIALDMAMHVTLDKFPAAMRYAKRMHQDTRFLFLRTLATRKVYSSILLTPEGQRAYDELTRAGV